MTFDPSKGRNRAGLIAVRPDEVTPDITPEEWEIRFMIMGYCGALADLGFSPGIRRIRDPGTGSPAAQVHWRDREGTERSVAFGPLRLTEKEAHHLWRSENTH